MTKFTVLTYAFWRWKLPILLPAVTAFWIAKDVLRTRRYKQKRALEVQQQQHQ